MISSAPEHSIIYSLRRKQSLCHKDLRLAFPAFARSHKMGRANCFKGDFCVMTFLRSGMMPTVAASSCRDLERRHMENTVWKMCEQISCNGELVYVGASSLGQLTLPCSPFIILPSNPTSTSNALEFCKTSMSCGEVDKCLMALTAATSNFRESRSQAFRMPTMSAEFRTRCATAHG